MDTKTLDRAWDLAHSDDPEYKTIRRVRTPSGQRRFGQPIGSIIVRDSVLDKIKILEPEWDGWDRVEGPGGKKYDVGYDDETEKWIATSEGNWDDVIAKADNEEDVFRNLNEKLGGKAKLPPNTSNVSKGGFDVSTLSDRSKKQYDDLDSNGKREYLKARGEGEGHRAALDRAKGGSFTQGPESRSGSNEPSKPKKATEGETYGGYEVGKSGKPLSPKSGIKNNEDGQPVCYVGDRSITRKKNEPARIWNRRVMDFQDRERRRYERVLSRWEKEKSIGKKPKVGGEDKKPARVPTAHNIDPDTKESIRKDLTRLATNLKRNGNALLGPKLDRAFRNWERGQYGDNNARFAEIVEGWGRHTSEQRFKDQLAQLAQKIRDAEVTSGRGKKSIMNRIEGVLTK